MMSRQSWVVLFLLLALSVLLGRRAAVPAAASVAPQVGAPPISVLPPDYVPDLGDDQMLPPAAADAPSREVAATIPIHYGVNFITSAEEPADAQRYGFAKSTDARWDRFPFYWQAVERSENQYTWSALDPVVSADINQGYLINAILMGVPGFYFSNGQAVPNSLWQPVFADGTDVPGAGKTINPANRWARYVNAAVNRYRPGGTLAQAQGWPAAAGVRQWEIWNEPDLDWFWAGSKDEFARLLKVGFLAVKHADSGAQVIFGGLANNFDDLNYYKDVLTILSRDPTAAGNNFYHDIAATHAYYYPWQAWYHVYRMATAQRELGLAKPIWLNEMGVAVWDDYPGPVWDGTSPYRATQTQQADYMIQTAFYSVFAGADAIFYFQLTDGCGNQPQGNDFPPHNGNLCASDGSLVGNGGMRCYGDAHGLQRNARDAACFRQHPQAETARPVTTAYELVTQYLQDVVPIARIKYCTHELADDGQEWIAYYRPNTNQRIMALWSCEGYDQTAVVPAIDSGAELIAPDGTRRYIGPSNGNYYITLPRATNQNYPNPNPNYFMLGGRPYILVERDLQPPTAGINAIAGSGGIAVNWWAGDGHGGGVARYDLTVAVDGGAPQAWRTGVTTTSDVWNGSYQHSVTFGVVAIDRGGNRSQAAAKQIGSAPPPAAPMLVKTVSPSVAQADEIVVYRVTLTGVGSVATTLALTDTLPTGVTLFPASLFASHGAATVQNGQIQWSGTIAPGQRVTLSYSARVNANVAHLATLTNRVAAVSTGGVTLQAAADLTVVDLAQLPHRIALPIVRR